MSENIGRWVLIVSLAIFLVILIVIIFRGSTPDALIIPIDNTTESGFMYQCKTKECSTGLSCDPIFGVCKSSSGSKCLTGSDCVSGYHCSNDAGTGICVNSESSVSSNIPNDACPCPTGMTCTTVSGVSYPI